MLDERMLWTAVTTRDPKWDGMFVYGVASTRIFCRPTCPSRRPRRAGVRFFATPESASEAGFRACRRCRPSDLASAEPAIARVRRACEIIARRSGRAVSLAALARQVGGSPYHLQRTFRTLLGVSPREYAETCRLGCLRAELRNGDGVSAAVYGAGYGSSSRVYEKSARTLGMTPATYARGGAGEHVHFVITPSPLGQMLGAATPRGVCRVKLGDDAAALERELRAEYPAAQVAPGDDRLSAWIARIVDFVKGESPDPRLPLDVRATAFQWRVWRELQKIPRGMTRSYAEIAARIGAPTAARAVARACAANPVALLIPCHRVVQTGGGLGGYHWGVERKRALLAGERGTLA